MDSVDTPEIHGILIARHGKLVLEEYFHGEHRDKLHETRSAAKSVTAALVGAAIQAGAPLKLSTPGLPGHERRRLPGGPGAAEARHDPGAPADHVVRLLLRRHQPRRARQ